MIIDAPTFVIARRIAHPIAEVHRGLADRIPIDSSNVFDLGTRGFLYVDEAFRPIAPLCSRQPLPTWSAYACLLSDRRRVVSIVELEVSMWSLDASELQLRPIARHPERWSTRRTHSYFALAHDGADAVSQRLSQRVVDTREVVDVTIEEEGRAQDPRVGSRITAHGRRGRYLVGSAAPHGLLSSRTASDLHTSPTVRAE